MQNFNYTIYDNYNYDNFNHLFNLQKKENFYDEKIYCTYLISQNDETKENEKFSNIIKKKEKKNFTYNIQFNDITQFNKLEHFKQNLYYLYQTFIIFNP